MISSARVYWFLIGGFFAALNLSSPAQAQTCASTSVLSFNIRYGETGLSSVFDANGWNNIQNPRRQRVIDTIRRDLPDIIGLQEVLDFQQNDLKSALPEYDVWGVGRDDGLKKGEAVPLFFKRSRYLKEEAGHFWLSDTPEVAGTVFSGSGSIRMASWIRLFDRDCQLSLLVLNTHWDNVSQSSRERSSELIKQRLGKLVADSEFIVVGDFNSVESNPAVANLIGGWADHPLADSFRQVNTKTVNEATFHDFTGRIQGERIDFILLSEALHPIHSEIRRDVFAGRYPSDHYPVATTLEHEPIAGQELRSSAD